MIILNEPKVGWRAGGALGTACLPGGKEPSWASPPTSSVLFLPSVEGRPFTASPRSPRNRHPGRPPIRLDAAIAPAALFPYAQRKASKRSGLGEISDGHLQGGQKARSQARAVAPTRHLCSRRWQGKT